MRLRIILAFHMALIYYTQDFRVYEEARDQPMPEPFPAPPTFWGKSPGDEVDCLQQELVTWPLNASSILRYYHSFRITNFVKKILCELLFLRQRRLKNFHFLHLTKKFLPCEQWFLQAGRYASKGEKPLRATLRFPSRMRVHLMSTSKRQMASLPLISEKKIGT